MLSVRSTLPPFSISSFLAVGSYLSASVCAGVLSFTVNGPAGVSCGPSGSATSSFHV